MVTLKENIVIQPNLLSFLIGENPFINMSNLD